MWNSYARGSEFEMAYLPLLLKGVVNLRNWYEIDYQRKKIMPLFVVHSFFFPSVYVMNLSIRP